MSHQSPDSSDASQKMSAPPTPSEAKPAGSVGGDDDDDNNTNNNDEAAPKARPARPPRADFTASETNAQAKIRLCLQFKRIAGHYLESCAFPRRDPNNPTEDERKDLQTLMNMWSREILQNGSGTGLNVVLKEPFVGEAEEEIKWLDGFDRDEAAEDANVAWREVLKLAGECKWWKFDVDRAMGRYM